MFANTGLVEQAQKALSENWGYCLGTYGQILTDTVLKDKCSQSSGVGSYNTQHKEYLQKFIGKRVSDCYGIVTHIEQFGERIKIFKKAGSKTLNYSKKHSKIRERS